MKTCSLNRWLPALLAGLCVVASLARAGESPAEADSAAHAGGAPSATDATFPHRRVGYTELQTNLPGGRQLLYGSKRGGVRQLFVLNLADRDEQQLTDLKLGHAAMWGHWQPVATADGQTRRLEDARKGKPR